MATSRMSMFFLATQINYLEKESKIFNRVVFIAWSIIPVPNNPFIHQLLKPFRTSSDDVIWPERLSQHCICQLVIGIIHQRWTRQLIQLNSINSLFEITESVCYVRYRNDNEWSRQKKIHIWNSFDIHISAGPEDF